MGSACCVAARDQTTPSGRAGPMLQRNVPCSPSWNIRWEWDKQRHTVAAQTSVTWASDGINHPDRFENSKSQVVRRTKSGAESAVENSQLLACEMSPVSDESCIQSRTPVSDVSLSRSVSVEVKQADENHACSDQSPWRWSPLMPLSSSSSTSPFPSRVRAFPASLTPSRWGKRAVGIHLERQVSDGQLPESTSHSVYEDRPPPVLSDWRTQSVMDAYDRSSDGWSMHGFPEFVDSFCRDTWSFDSDSLCFNDDQVTKPGSQVPGSSSMDKQICGICSKLLAETSSFGSQKIFSNNELSVVSVLICGHVYHSECLESMTPEISKYDPACPVCTFGGKQTLKMSKKVLKAEKSLKAKSCKLTRNRIMDSDFDSTFIALTHWNTSMQEKKGSKECSSSARSSFQKPFLKRHFSFGGKSSRLSSEDQSIIKKKGHFWTRSHKQ